MRKRIYVTGPINRMNEFTHKTSLINISLLCRKIIMLGHIPYSLVGQIDDWKQDVRLERLQYHWLSSMCMPIMDICQFLCYIPDMSGMKSTIMAEEMDIWRVSGKRMLTADYISKFLLEGKDNYYGDGYYRT